LPFVVPLLPLAAGWFACQDPFADTREELDGDRILAVRALAEPAAEGAGTVLRPSAILVQEGRMWSDRPAELRWAWLEPSALPGASTFDLPAAEGPAPVLEAPASDATLALQVTFASGAVREATLDVPAGGAPPLLGGRSAEIDVAILPDLPPLTATPETLARDARADATALPATFVQPGAWARFRLALDGEPPPELRTRWVRRGPGTLLALDALTTDYAPAELFIDDLEIEEATPIEPGPLTLAAVLVNDLGAVDAVWLDVGAGAPLPAGLHTAGGHFMPATSEAASETTGAGRVRATLVADDEAPWGLRAEDIAPVVEPLPAVDPFGTEGLACEGASGPFEPRWLAEARCTRTQVVGATVVVETR
jgi:hypothetical protein